MTGCVFFFEHKTAYELRISDWSSDVCSSDLHDFNARVRVPGGFRLTNSAGERRWNTASGRAAFISHDVPTDLPVHRARASREQPVFTLTTVRSHDQYNTTIYGLDDRYRGVLGERRALFAHAGDIAGLGLRAGDRVDPESLCGDGLRRQARSDARRVGAEGVSTCSMAGSA